jgi:hypothetical protein
MIQVRGFTPLQLKEAGVSASALIEAGFTPYEVYRAGFPINEIPFAPGTRLVANVNGHFIRVSVDAADQCRDGRVLLFRGRPGEGFIPYRGIIPLYDYLRVRLSDVVVLPDLEVCSGHPESFEFDRVAEKGFRPYDQK